MKLKLSFLSPVFWIYVILQSTAFSVELPIPPLETGTINPHDQTREFQLQLQTGEVEFFAGIKTKSLGINQAILGPTIKIKNGEQTRFLVKNNLNEASSLHWHGMLAPAIMDGGPHSMIASGSTWISEFKITNPASTLWYHPHPIGNTGKQVYMGIAGLMIIEDEKENALDLPRNYGVDDIPLIIQDRRFDNNGQFQYIQSMMDLHMGIFGNKLLVNGAMQPTSSLPAKIIRFRILNGSNARIYELRFNDKRQFSQIATDGGLLDEPLTLTSLVLSPGERVEILVDFSADFGKQVVLESFTPAAIDKPETSFPILPINVNRTYTGAKESIPTDLVNNSWLLETDAINTREFKLQMNMGGMMGSSGMSHDSLFSINGAAMNMGLINETVKIDTTEIWKIESEEMIHNFHIHNVQFQVLDRAGRAPFPYEQGWKDTVLVSPDSPVRLLLRFTNYTDPKVPYMYHCHILEHEDQGLMGQFIVIK